MKKHAAVLISEEAEEFYLSCRHGWQKLIGHPMLINQYQFSAIPYKDHIRVSEVGSGALLTKVPYHESLSTKEDLMEFLNNIVAPIIIVMIEKAGAEEFERQIIHLSEVAEKTNGRKPEGKKVNIDLLSIDTDGKLH